jgi:hypothetical protein
MNPMGTVFTASEAPVESWKLQDVKPRIVLTVPQPIKQENSRNGSALNTDQQTITAEAQRGEQQYQEKKKPPAQFFRFL